MEDYEPMCWSRDCPLDDMHVFASTEYVRVPEMKSVYDPVPGPLTGIDGLTTFRDVRRVVVKVNGVYRKYCEDCAKEFK